MCPPPRPHTGLPGVQIRGAQCHTHLPVRYVFAALAGRAGPALVPGPGPAVVRWLLGVALLLGGWGVRVVVAVVAVLPVPPVLGPAPLLVSLLRWQVARLGGHAQVCPQAWARVGVGVRQTDGREEGVGEMCTRAVT